MTHNSNVLSRHSRKDAAIEAGRAVAKANQPSQLVVHKADGTFETEYTYGNDPVSTVG